MYGIVSSENTKAGVPLEQKECDHHSCGPHPTHFRLSSFSLYESGIVRFVVRVRSGHCQFFFVQPES